MPLILTHSISTCAPLEIPSLHKIATCDPDSPFLTSTGGAYTILSLIQYYGFSTHSRKPWASCMGFSITIYG